MVRSLFTSYEWKFDDVRLLFTSQRPKSSRGSLFQVADCADGSDELNCNEDETSNNNNQGKIGLILLTVITVITYYLRTKSPRAINYCRLRIAPTQTDKNFFSIFNA